MSFTLMNNQTWKNNKLTLKKIFEQAKNLAVFSAKSLLWHLPDRLGGFRFQELCGQGSCQRDLDSIGWTQSSPQRNHLQKSPPKSGQKKIQKNKWIT